MASIKMLVGEPALILTEKSGRRNLVVADMHLGVECSLGMESLARASIQKNLDRLEKLITKNKIHRLILVGDIRHKLPAEKEYWQALTEQEEMDRRIALEVPEMLLRFKKLCEVLIIPGNHDGALKSYFPSVDELLIENVGLLHGHKRLSDKMYKADHIIAAHSHPAVVFRDKLGYRAAKKAWVVGKLKETDARVIVMPAFNEFITGTGVNEKQKLLGPMFKTDTFKVDKVELYTLEGIAVGKASSLGTKSFFGDDQEEYEDYKENKKTTKLRRGTYGKRKIYTG